MDQDKEETPSAAERKPPFLPSIITAGPRKFSHYVLDPERARGKDGVFIDLFGYRPRNEADARELAATYVEQATARLAAGDYVPSREDEFGRRYIIVIEVKGMRLRSVWLLRTDGVLSLVTPFRGFARRSRS